MKFCTRRRCRQSSHTATPPALKAGRYLDYADAHDRGKFPGSMLCDQMPIGIDGGINRRHLSSLA